MQDFSIKLLVLETLAYPLLTVLRRLEAQGGRRAGMLPSRYIGPLHATGLMFREEGIRGLYRGYCAHVPAMVIQWSIIYFAG